MTTRKRNDFLDIPSDEENSDNDAGYDSEAAEESEGRTRTVKRRRTQTGDVDDSQSGSDDEGSGVSEGEGEESDEEAGGVRLPKSKSKKQNEQEESADNDDDDEEGQFQDFSTSTERSASKKGKNATSKPLDNLKTKPPKKNKTGVVYFSSLPPYLKPFALKSLLETRGFEPITKVFLSPEVRPASAPRRRSNKRKTYSDGWVEFASKKTAKIAAETLNATIVGGRKGGWYHDDVWNLKYLKGFKWADLMEQVQRERSEREAKRRIEDARARKEEKVFLQGVERGKMLDGITRKNEEKRKRKMEAAAAAGNGGGSADAEKEAVNARRLFKQSEVKLGRDRIPKAQGDVEEGTRRVLGKIF